MRRPTSDRAFFLRATTEIEHTKRVGFRRTTPYFNLVSCPSSSPRTRIGIIVGRRLGTAVVRNRAKRVFRDLARRVRGELAAARNILVFPRREALALPHAALRQAWIGSLREEGLLNR
jgi:ribonuclease P protein component